MSNSYHDSQNGKTPQGYMPKQGKIYIPGLGKYFKISPDEIFIDDLRDEVADAVFNKIDDMIEDIVKDKVEEIAGLDDYLTKEEELIIREAIIASINELSDALYEATGEHTRFLTSEQVDTMIAKELESYYTKTEADSLHENIVTEFTQEEVLQYWYAMFPKD